LSIAIKDNSHTGVLSAIFVFNKDLIVPNLTIRFCPPNISFRIVIMPEHDLYLEVDVGVH
jgi:hypothetical protein